MGVPPVGMGGMAGEDPPCRGGTPDESPVSQREDRVHVLPGRAPRLHPHEADPSPRGTGRGHGGFEGL